MQFMKFKLIPPSHSVRDLLRKELKWRLIPIRIEPAAYDRLVTIAPEGDVSQLLKQAVEKLLEGIPQ